MVHNYIASCMSSFLGSGCKFCLSLIPAVVTFLEPEITSLLSAVHGLQFLGQRLEDRTLISNNWEFIDCWGSSLLHVTQSVCGLGRIVDQSLLGLVFSSGEQDELGLAGVESSDVLGLHLSTLVASSVVNS